MSTSVEEKVIQIIMDALSIEDEEVTLESNIVDDLAAESIDFVDIAFNLEKEFGFKINPGDIFPAFLKEVTIFDENGKLTEEVKQNFKNDYSFISQEIVDTFEKEQDPNIFFTVQVIVDYVKYKQQNQE